MPFSTFTDLSCLALLLDFSKHMRLTVPQKTSFFLPKGQILVEAWNRTQAAEDPGFPIPIHSAYPTASLAEFIQIRLAQCFVRGGCGSPHRVQNSGELVMRARRRLSFGIS